MIAAIARNENANRFVMFLFLFEARWWEECLNDVTWLRPSMHPQASRWWVAVVGCRRLRRLVPVSDMRPAVACGGGGGVRLVKPSFSLLVAVG